MKTYEDYDFQYVELVWFNYAASSYAAPTSVDADAFATDYGFTTALALADPDGFYALWEDDGASPTISFIGPDMEVLAVDTDTTSPSAYLEMD